MSKGMRHRKAITRNCKECGLPYTDNIDPAVDPQNGGYIVCPACLRKPDTKKELSLSEIVQAMQTGGLRQWRVQKGVSRKSLAGLLGVSEKAIRWVDANGRPSKRIYEAIASLYLKSDKTPCLTPRNQIAEGWYLPSY